MDCTCTLGIPYAEPIGSSKKTPLAVVLLPPQTWRLSLSLPCVKGGGTATELPEARLRALGARLCRDGGIVLSYFNTNTIPQSPSVTAPFTQGSLSPRRKCAKLKLFGATGAAGGFCYTIKTRVAHSTRARYAFCSSERESIETFIEESLRSATSRSISAGTAYTRFSRASRCFARYSSPFA